jgi:hypothetical protein
MGELLLPNKQALYPYRTQEGRVLRRSEVNRHHVWNERRQYSSNHEKRFRNMAGFVLPMVITWHQDLHANVKPPKKPSRNLMEQIMDFNESLDGSHYARFSQVTRFILKLAETSQNIGIADQAQKIGTNLLLQEAFIDKGSVTLIEDIE